MKFVKNALSLAIVLLLAAPQSRACNMCGCQTSLNYTGLLNYTGSNFVSLQGAYSGMHTLDEFSGADIFSRYISTMLTGSVEVLRNRWDMQLYVPYVFNSYQVADAAPFQVSGLGDIGWLNHIKILGSNDTSDSNWNLYLKAGVEMPSGEFYSAYREEDVPPAMSAGSGSWDVMTGMRFSYFKNNLGVFANYLFKYNTENAHNYKYGNQHIATAMASYRISAGKNTFSPLAGSIAEFIDYDEFYGYEQHGTSGVNIYATLGLEYNIANTNVGFNIDMPVYSKYDNDASAVLRGSLHVGYTF